MVDVKYVMKEKVISMVGFVIYLSCVIVYVSDNIFDFIIVVIIWVFFVI